MNEVGADDVLRLCTSFPAHLCKLKEYFDAFPHRIDQRDTMPNMYCTSIAGRSYTPVEMAVANNSPECFELLVDLGADVDATVNPDGLFVSAGQVRALRIIPYLVAYGAKMTRPQLIDLSGEPGRLPKIARLIHCDEHKCIGPVSQLHDCSCYEYQYKRIDHFYKKLYWDSFFSQKFTAGFVIAACADTILQCPHIRCIRMQTLRRRGYQTCIGLAALNLPALVMLYIIEHLNYAILALPVHIKWQLICRIKHFRTVESAFALAANPFVTESARLT